MVREGFAVRFFWLVPFQPHHKQGSVPVVEAFCYWYRCSHSLWSFWFPGLPYLWHSHFMTACALRLWSPYMTLPLGVCSLPIADDSPGYTLCLVWFVPSSDILLWFWCPNSTLSPKSPHLPSTAQDLPSFQAPVELSDTRSIISFRKRELYKRLCFLHLLPLSI